MNMQLAMELGAVCDLKTLGECVLNVDLHSLSLFHYGEMTGELNELQRDIVEMDEISEGLWEEMLVPAYIIKSEKAKMNAFFDKEFERNKGFEPQEVCFD